MTIPRTRSIPKLMDLCLPVIKKHIIKHFHKTIRQFHNNHPKPLSQYLIEPKEISKEDPTSILLRQLCPELEPVKDTRPQLEKQIDVIYQSLLDKFPVHVLGKLQSPWLLNRVQNNHLLTYWDDIESPFRPTWWRDGDWSSCWDSARLLKHSEFHWSPKELYFTRLTQNLWDREKGRINKLTPHKQALLMSGRTFVKQLNIQSNRLNQSIPFATSYFPNLESLRIYNPEANYEMNDMKETFTLLQKFQQLRCLILDLLIPERIQYQLLAILRQTAPKLDTLCFPLTNFELPNDEKLHPLNLFKKLKHVDFSSKKRTPYKMENISQYHFSKQLASFVPPLEFSLHALQHVLSGNPFLKSINLCRVQPLLTSRNLIKFAETTQNLEQLTIRVSYNEKFESLIYWIQKNQQTLKHLKIIMPASLTSREEIKESFKILAKKTGNLRSYSGPDISIADMIKKNPYLERLGACFLPIGKISSFKNLRNLQTLCISTKHHSTHSFKQLASQLLNLKELYIDITTRHVKRIYRRVNEGSFSLDHERHINLLTFLNSLKMFKQLVRLHLNFTYSNYHKYERVKLLTTIANLVKELPTLKHLELSIEPNFSKSLRREFRKNKIDVKVIDYLRTRLKYKW